MWGPRWIPASWGRPQASTLEAQPKDEELGSRGKGLPGSPRSPLRPGRPSRPGGPAAPALPSGARHTSSVTVEAKDMASTQPTSQPRGASMMPL